MIVNVQLLEPVNAAAHETPGAVLIDRAGRIVCGWEITEPELLRVFEQTRALSVTCLTVTFCRPCRGSGSA